MANSRPDTPAKVARQLRQESLFGCALCGFPFVVYHHIVPWEEDEHFRPDDMVAVCPNCHARVHRMHRSRQYDIKRNPRNASRKSLWAEMEFSILSRKFMVGDVLIEGASDIVMFNDIPVLSWRIIDGRVLLDATLHSEDGTIALSVRENEVVLKKFSMWDFVFKFNYIKINNKRNSISWEIDLRKDPATFRTSTFPESRHIEISRRGIISRENLCGLSHARIANHDVGVRFVTDDFLARNPNPTGGFIFSG